MNMSQLTFKAKSLDPNLTTLQNTRNFLREKIKGIVETALATRSLLWEFNVTDIQFTEAFLTAGFDLHLADVNQSSTVRWSV